MKICGVWLPVITPFKNGEVDYTSYCNLINYYLPTGINGFIPLGTTGESPVIENHEFEKIIEITVKTVNNQLPVFIGAGGNFTKKVIEKIKIVEKYNVQGILSACPYYNRPGQEGLYQHFKALSEATDLNIIIYNIPYRTGVNMSNETLFRLAELKNITGVKDSCGNINQSIDLLFNKPKGFNVLTGEDYFFYTMLVNGADGGILAAAHINTSKFIEIYNLIRQNNFNEALRIWKSIAEFIPLLFKEPNPGPIKYLLWKKQMILSPELRLPLTGISAELKEVLNKFHTEIK